MIYAVTGNGPWIDLDKLAGVSLHRSGPGPSATLVLMMGDSGAEVEIEGEESYLRQVASDLIDALRCYQNGGEDDERPARKRTL